MLAYARHELVDAVVDTGEVDGNGLVEVLWFRSQQRSQWADAGIVRQQMDLPEPGLDLVGGGFHGRAVNDVHLDRMHVILASLEPIEGGADLVVADVAND